MYQPRSEHLRLPDQHQAGALRARLDSAGYVVMREFANAALLDALRADAARLCAKSREELDGTVVHRDQSERVLSMHYLDRHSDLLFDLTRLPEVQLLADRLVGARTVPFLTEYFGKPGPDSEPTPPHQDQIFYRDHFGEEQAISMWIALTDVDDESGVLQYATRQPSVGELLKHHDTDAANFRAELIDGSAFSYVSAPVPAGGAVVHHSYAVHRSGPIHTGAPRSAVALNFRRSAYREHLNPLVPA
ncbi:phytanoyl-CoA dioxygenase family protein [Nocardia wallacei]|uniref:phytanoyl-CoA dioxygenase family protein n=1 Tax=Nocardia wallacei TaxID=480035 RepID=UPI002456A9F4|nr:phytanoyl-CoA dioxygenase family protein [Nocardia wallacei]